MFSDGYCGAKWEWLSPGRGSASPGGVFCFCRALFGVRDRLGRGSTHGGRRRFQAALCHVGVDIFQGDFPPLPWGMRSEQNFSFFSNFERSSASYFVFIFLFFYRSTSILSANSERQSRDGPFFFTSLICKCTAVLNWFWGKNQSIFPVVILLDGLDDGFSFLDWKGHCFSSRLSLLAPAGRLSRIFSPRRRRKYFSLWFRSRYCQFFIILLLFRCEESSSAFLPWILCRSLLIWHGRFSKNPRPETTGTPCGITPCKFTSANFVQVHEHLPCVLLRTIFSLAACWWTFSAAAASSYRLFGPFGICQRRRRPTGRQPTVYFGWNFSEDFTCW